MRTLLAIDPGKRACGAALFVDGKLVRAGLPRAALAGDNLLAVTVSTASAVIEWLRTTAPDGVVVEWPRVYPGASFQQEDPNDLLPLAGVNVAIAYAISTRWGTPIERLVTYAPRDWKGTIKKTAMTERIRERITETGEIDNCEPCPARLQHNMLDAVGLGLKHLGRLERKRVYPR